MVAQPAATVNPPEDFFPQDTTDFSEQATAEEHWKPLDLETAARMLPAEIQDALKTLLKGDFREVKRYRPKQSTSTKTEQEIANSTQELDPADGEVEDL